MFFIDDLILRSIGLALPPFDMIWLLEMLRDYTSEVLEEENQRGLRNSLKENRLLFELGEISSEEYERRNEEITQKLKKVEKVNRLNLKQRINLLG
jgi:hypothetical protein